MVIHPTKSAFVLKGQLPESAIDIIKATSFDTKNFVKYLGGALSAVQLFVCLAVVETHTLWYFGHHCCVVVGFDALGIWHFWMFTPFHPFLLFCTHFLPISTTSTLFLG